MKKISVVIPMFNSFGLMKKNLESLSAQKNAEIEVLIVDDKSTDDSLERAKAYALGSRLQIKIIKNPCNVGPGGSRNNGISFATGDYITFVDSDDYLSENFTEKIAPLLENNYDCVVFDYERNGEDGKKIGGGKCMTSDRIAEGLVGRGDALVYVSGSTMGKIYRTAFIKDRKVRFAETYRNEDMPFTKTAVGLAETVYYCPEPFYHYVQREQSLMHDNTLTDEKNCQNAFATVKNRLTGRGLDAELSAMELREVLNNTVLIRLEKHEKRKNVRAYIKEHYRKEHFNGYFAGLSKKDKVLSKLAYYRLTLLLSLYLVLKNAVKSRETRAINGKSRFVGFPDVYLIAYLLCLLICAGNKAYGTYGVIVPFIKVNTSYIFLALNLAGFSWVLWKRRWKPDIVLGILLCRVALGALQFLIADVPSDYFGNFVESIFPFFIYFVFMNAGYSSRRLYNIFMTFGILIALQCLWAYGIIHFKLQVPYDNAGYKSYFILPIGSTNRISPVLIPILILGDQTIEKKRYRLPFVLLMTVATLLCKSRGGMVTLAVYFIAKLFLPNRGKHTKLQKNVRIALPVVMAAALIGTAYSPLGEKIRTVLFGYSGQWQGWDHFFSGRITIYENTVQFAKTHQLLFGNGVSYYLLDYTEPHNILLQLLYQNGILGIALFVLFLAVTVKRWSVQAKAGKKWYFALLIALPVVLLNAMVEDILLANFIPIFALPFIASAKENGLSHSARKKRLNGENEVKIENV